MHLVLIPLVLAIMVAAHKSNISLTEPPATGVTFAFPIQGYGDGSIHIAGDPTEADITAVADAMVYMDTIGTDPLRTHFTAAGFDVTITGPEALSHNEHALFLLAVRFMLSKASGRLPNLGKART